MSRRDALLTGILFCASGVAALVYQVVWQRILALHTGVGIHSVALITAAFMAGLGLGSHWGGVLSARVRPGIALRVFAGLELTVGAFALASCPIYYDLLYLEGSRLYATPWRSGALHFGALLVPTALMGMSLPFLVRAMVRDADTAGATVGYLYGINVLGASIGALLAPWVLIRLWGLRGAVLAGVGCNVLAGLLALLLGRGRPPAAERPAGGARPTEGVETPAARPFGLWVALYAMSGFCALSLEILWFRLIDVGVKATAFTFGTVLSVYLLGLAAGSLAGTALVARMRRPLRAFLACQCALLTYAGAAVLLVARAPADLPGLRWFHEYWGQRIGFVLGSASDPPALFRLYVLWPAALYAVPTALMGLSFAVLQRAVHDDVRTSGRKVGVLQAANIAGCAAGSLAVGLLALDALGTTGALRLLLGCGLVFAAVGLRYYGARSFGLPCAALLSLIALAPGQDELWRRLHGAGERPALIEEDATSVIALTARGGDQWRVFVNGRAHSSLPFGGIHTELGAVPALIHPAPADVAIIGLGSGDTAWAAGCRAETRRVFVFEICAPQERLLRRLARAGGPGRLASFLDDPRMRFAVADGRIRLDRGLDRYDLIEADALPRESAYSGNLYSLEFFQRAARSLKPGGVMCTWAATPRVLATFARAFPSVVACADGAILVGSRAAIEGDADEWTGRLSAQVRSYLRFANAQAVLRALRTCRVVDPAEVPRLEPNRDLFPRDEFGTP